jgi:hypothetical protein
MFSGTVNVLATIFLVALAGYATVRQTGSVRDSALAGLVAAIVGEVVGLLLQGLQYLVDASTFAPMLTSFTSSRLPGAAIVVSLVIGVLWGVALALASGAGLGHIEECTLERASGPQKGWRCVSSIPKRGSGVSMRQTRTASTHGQ